MTKGQLAAAILRLYTSLPDTPTRPHPGDRRTAQELAGDGVTFQQAQQALFLATARRSYRATERTPLQQVRSLAYYLPTIEEVRSRPIDPGYLQYLKERVAPQINLPDSR